MNNERKVKVILGKSGGTASEGSITHRLTIPNSWAKDMGITEDSREVCMQYDEIEKKISVFPQQVKVKECNGKYQIVEGILRAKAMIKLHGSLSAVNIDSGENVIINRDVLNDT